MNTPRVSVIVPVRDDPDGIGQLLSRLAEQTVPSDEFEVVIGDDGSVAGSLDGVQTADGRVRVLAGPPQTSYAARNRAAAAARGGILAFCDSDCLPDPTWLENAIKALAEADLVAGEVILVPPAKPTVWSLLTVDMFLDQGRNVLRYAAVTANLVVRKDLFEEVGGFDPSLPSGGDYEFTRRALSHGARLHHEPTAVMRHPTIDRARPFLRKVWFTNHWSAVRRARYGFRFSLKALLTFVPILGVAVARRHAYRPVASLSRPRLRAAGIVPGRGHDFRAIPVLYLVVAQVAGVARGLGWLRARRERTRADQQAPAGRAGARTIGDDRTPRTSARGQPRPAGSLPNVIVIGGQKCGTSSLHYYMDVHPEISMSRPKELNFFVEDGNWARGPDWYARQFDSRSPVRGESSPNYSAYPVIEGVAERMASVIPEARLIYLVRDPVERIASQWVHNLARHRERGGLATTLLHEAETYLARSRFHLQLEQFRPHFDDQRILVLDSHALLHERLATLRRVFEFLDVDADVYHPRFERLVNRASDQRRASSLVSPPPDVREALGPDVIDELRRDAERLRETTGMNLEHWSV